MRSDLLLLGLLMASVARTSYVHSLHDALRIDLPQFDPPSCRTDTEDVLGQLSDWRDLISRPPADLQRDKSLLV